LSHLCARACDLGIAQGSRLTNFVGILSQGLRIAPPEAPKSGYRFGKGSTIPSPPFSPSHAQARAIDADALCVRFVALTIISLLCRLRLQVGVVLSHLQGGPHGALTSPELIPLGPPINPLTAYTLCHNHQGIMLLNEVALGRMCELLVRKQASR
jgi:hypothetical protein